MIWAPRWLEKPPYQWCMVTHGCPFAHDPLAGPSETPEIEPGGDLVDEKPTVCTCLSKGQTKIQRVDDFGGLWTKLIGGSWFAWGYCYFFLKTAGEIKLWTYPSVKSLVRFFFQTAGEFFSQKNNAGFAKHQLGMPKWAKLAWHQLFQTLHCLMKDTGWRQVNIE